MGEQQQRKVGLALGLGIFFVPPVFAWFTLRPGYSVVARGVSMTWMGIILLGMVRGPSTDSRPSPPASPPAAAAATVVADPPPTPPSIQAIEVTNAKLWKDYHANEVAADGAYKGKKLLVRGAVESITKNAFGTIVVSLRSPNEYMPTMASVDDSESEAAAQLGKGQKVSLLCEGAGMILGRPSLSDCKIR